MPIIDYDGTTSYEIGAVIDYDGTTSYEIGTVIDYDGTASYIIFAPTPDYLFNAGDQATDYTGGWQASSYCISHIDSWYSKTGTATIGTSNIVFITNGSTNQYRGVGVQTKNKIDFSEIKSLTATFSGTANGTYDYIMIAIVDSINGNIVAISRSAASANTLTLSTTSYNGSYYVYVGAFTSDGNAFTKTFTKLQCTT